LVREVPDMHVTCSVGVTSVADGDVALRALVDHAHRALAQAIQSGRNCSQSSAGPLSLPDAGPDAGPDEGPDDAADAAPLREALRDGVAWKAAREWIMKQARDSDRGLACLVASLDAGQASPASAQADVDQLERWAVSLAPRRSVVARTANGEVVVLVLGWGLQDIHTCAIDLQRRVQRGHPKLHLGLCIGLDALPARALGAPTLPERAAKAMLWQRQSQGSGVASFNHIAAPSAKGRTR
jgi:GGDEF domain-containing protein